MAGQGQMGDGIEVGGVGGGSEPPVHVWRECPDPPSLAGSRRSEKKLFWHCAGRNVLHRWEGGSMTVMTHRLLQSATPENLVPTLVDESPKLGSPGASATAPKTTPRSYLGGGVRKAETRHQ